MSYLTKHTPIPKRCRGQVRAYVRHQPDFREWHMGLVKSRDVRNWMLRAYAIDTGKTGAIEFILATRRSS